MPNQWAHDGTCHITNCPHPPERTVTLDNGIHTVTKDVCAEHHSLAHRAHDLKINTLRDCQHYWGE